MIEIEVDKSQIYYSGNSPLLPDERRNHHPMQWLIQTLENYDEVKKSKSGEVYCNARTYTDFRFCGREWLDLIDDVVHLKQGILSVFNVEKKKFTFIVKKDMPDFIVQVETRS